MLIVRKCFLHGAAFTGRSVSPWNADLEASGGWFGGIIKKGHFLI
jgi:hypothetical protein